MQSIFTYVNNYSGIFQEYFRIVLNVSAMHLKVQNCIISMGIIKISTKISIRPRIPLLEIYPTEVFAQTTRASIHVYCITACNTKI